MKWEKLKEKIQDEIALRPNTSAAKEIRRLAQEQGTNVQGYLRTYDVRNVDALRERFRHVFPVYLQTCMLWLNKDSKGNWTIDDKVK